MIGLSPLHTSHLRLLQQTWVQTFRILYHSFILLMWRSSGFGSYAWNSCINLLTLRVQINSLRMLQTKSRSLIMQKEPLHTAKVLRVNDCVKFRWDLIRFLIFLSFIVLVHYRWLNLDSMESGISLYITVNAISFYLLKDYKGSYLYRIIFLFIDRSLQSRFRSQLLAVSRLMFILTLLRCFNSGNLCYNIET